MGAAAQRLEGAAYVPLPAYGYQPAGQAFSTPLKSMDKSATSAAGSTPEHPIDLTDGAPVSSLRKRKITETFSEELPPSAMAHAGKGKTKSQATGSPKQKEEKRARRFRPNPPQAFYDIYSRALSQRFYVLKRTRCGTAECPEEKVEMTGSTGNIYTVHIGNRPSCTCPHAQKGNQCKHVLYVSCAVPRLLSSLLSSADSVASAQCASQLRLSAGAT